MTNPPFEYLPVAVRAWPDLPRKSSGKRAAGEFPRKLLIVDTETFTDPAQSLMFGSAKLAWVAFGYDDRFRVFPEPNIIDEVLFYADDLPVKYQEGFRVLADYCDRQNLKLISQSEFAATYVQGQGLPAFKGRHRFAQAMLTFFNAPFDISRLAFGYSNGEGANRGAFSFHMLPDDAGSSRYLAVRHIDSKKHLAKPSVLDLRTLTWAMTNRSHSLASACRAFQLPEGFSKGHAEQHGAITPEYIDYNRQDVTATAHLACSVLREYVKHPVGLPPQNALSPASVGKAYYDTMGITPVLDRENVPRDPVMMGNATSTFYGGRAEGNIRNTPVPVALLDFTSMYPTVNALLGLWDFLTASEITAADDTENVRAFLAGVNLETVLRPETWPQMTGMALIRPDGDILPVRAAYGADVKDVTNVGHNYLHSAELMWFQLADLVASKLLTGRTPDIIRAIRFTARGRLPELNPVDLMGSVHVNPESEDFFRYVTEQRQNIKAERRGSHPAACACQSCRVTEFLKVLANSTSYGVFVEMLRTDAGHEVSQMVYGMTGQPWEHKGTAVERAQKYCYPPVGAMITAGARLMLGILECLVTGFGGTGAFRDTDSTAVVATEAGGLVPCPGGPYELDGVPAVVALSRGQVDAVRNRVNALNPYRGVAGKAILKTEAECYAYVISAKRYALFTYDADGMPVVPAEVNGKRAYSEHGLGLYLNPADIESENRDWMRQMWQYIVTRGHGIDCPLPEWIDRPALTRSAVTSPDLMRWFADLNDGKPYRDQVKPFGFMLLCSERNRYGAVTGNAQLRFIAPYSANPADWEACEWKDLHNPDSPGYRLNRDFKAKTFHDVLAEYVAHAEVKSLGIDGKPCGPLTAGLLSRRTVRATRVKHIGKESNRLEDVENGMISEWDQVVTDYGELPKVSPEVVLFSQPGFTATWIAEQINAYSEWIRRKIADGEANITRLFGEPVTVTPTVIRKWRHGQQVSPELGMMLTTLAARIILPVTEIPEMQVSWSWRSNGGHRYTPGTLLAAWRDMGYPSPADGSPLPVPAIVFESEPKNSRICARPLCGNPVTRSNKAYCSEKCKRLVQKQRARARAKISAA